MKEGVVEVFERWIRLESGALEYAISFDRGRTWVVRPDPRPAEKQGVDVFSTSRYVPITPRDS